MSTCPAYDREKLLEMAHAVVGLDRTAAAKVLSDARNRPPHWFFWLWQQGLISGPVTHTAYVGINAGYTLAERVASPLLAAVIDKVRGGENNFLGQPVMAAVGMFHGVPEALRSAAQGFKTGQRVPLSSELELSTRGLKSPQSKGVSQPYAPIGPDWGVWKAGADFLGVPMKVRNWTEFGLSAPGRSANFIHTFFKVLNKEADARSTAYAAAAKEGLEPTSQQFWDRYRHHIANPTDEALTQNVNAAYSGTYMEKLGPKTGNLAQALRQTPLAWVFPFMHIPLNIKRGAIRYSPVAFLGPEMRATLMGERGIAEQNLGIAKVIGGSAILGYFVMQTLKGNSTGDYPTDQNERRDWEVQGIQPNSIRIGNEWVSTQRWGPAATHANLGANLAHIIAHYDGSDDEAMLKASGSALLAVVNSLANETGFLALHNMIDAMENPREIPKYVASQAGSFIPFSSFLGQTAAFRDPDVRQAKTFMDAIKYRLPGLRETLSPKRDPLFGEIEPNPAYHTVIRESPVSTDPVKMELAKLDIHPAAPRNLISVGPLSPGIKLPPKLYDEYQVLAGTLAKRLLENAVNGPGWYQMPAYARAETMRKMIDVSRTTAASAMKMRHPEIMQTATENAVAKVTGAKPKQLQQ